MMQSSVKKVKHTCTEHCLTQLSKTAWKIWSILAKVPLVLLSEIPNAHFPPSPSTVLSLAFIYRVYLIPSYNLLFDCCQTVTNQQVTYIQQPQHTFTGGQGGVVIIQPTGAVTTTAHGYPVAGQPAMYLPQQVSFINL